MAQHSEKEILTHIIDLMKQDYRLNAQIKGWYDYIPAQIPANQDLPAIGVGWLGNERHTHSIGGYLRRNVHLAIIVYVKEWEDKEAQDKRIELAEEVTNFLEKVAQMSEDDYWYRAIIARGGLSVEAAHNPIATTDTGFVYTALIHWQATYRRPKD